ncbi:ABC transporter permease [Propionibacterium australiense]|uniref:ABC transporter permease n=1 Tax=Propionibacterium australiense TaxID=119981 RepID=A0A383S2I3_9ACTN|nr:ABC transporter permease [Propionibacterium australiense]RLP11460.1 ABC transporter permease [Propionibacterium australiense]RLP12803.1 ABC transporter permease [Propionibacterium australiense]SYZ32157.1 Branched-chain amino acid transport system / permease component [Propionibacterium australiense]VEH90784.1 autoinducer 2 ABC transporter permease LsrC [Propionibacterium australiense]
MLGAIELGLLYGLMALGVYLTFRILDFADLTVDGSFTTGAGLCALIITNGGNPVLATAAGFGGGLLAGTVTGLLNTMGKIHPLLAGILTQIALYSINLRIMGKANLPLLRATTVFTPLSERALLGTLSSVVIFALVLALFVLVMDWFLATNLGFAMRATGDNESMARANGINTNTTKIIGLALSNGLVATSGALIAQFQGYADISMGIGLIVAGLASVIIGTAIFSSSRIAVATAAVCFGSIIYRVIIQLALMVGLQPNDMKLVSAVIVVLALLIPRWGVFANVRARRRARSLPAEPDVTASIEDRDPVSGLVKPGA